MHHPTTKTNRFRFTKKDIEALPTRERQYQVADTEIRGLFLMVNPGGAKTFCRYGRLNGKPRRIRIGPFPEISVSRARQKCAAINGNLAEGNAPKAPSRGGLTFGEMWVQYWDEHALIKKVESSRKHDLWQWKKLLQPAWELRKASDIKKSDVLELQGRVAKVNGKVTANRCLSLVKKVFNHAIEAERLELNPAARVKKYSERSRERFLQGDELPRFFKSLEEFDNRDVADYVRMALFTGARQTNVLSMRWEDIDFSTAVWTIPKTKSGASLRLPLVGPAMEILERRRNRSKYVFASHGKTGYMTRPGKAWERLLENAEIEKLTMHDLRRSLGSYQAAAGVSELVIGKTLGHAAGSRATSVYARLNLDPVRNAVELATDAMLAAAESEGK